MTAMSMLLIVMVVTAVAMIGLILLQQGKGADAGASFGGASQTVFGSSGAGSFLTKATYTLAVIFAVSCLTMAYLAKEKFATNLSEDGEVSEVNVDEILESDSDVPTIRADLQEVDQDVPEAPVLPEADLQDAPVDVPVPTDTPVQVDDQDISESVPELPVKE